MLVSYHLSYWILQRFLLKSFYWKGVQDQMRRETINFICEKHCYKVFCAKPHTACLPDNRKVVCTLKSEFLPLKNLPCTSSLQLQELQQHPPSSPSPSTRSEGKSLPAFFFISKTKPPCVTWSAEFAGLSLIASFRNTLQNLEFAGPRL